MIDIKHLRRDPGFFQLGADKKGRKINVAEVLKLDKRERKISAEIELLLAKRKKIRQAKEGAKLKEQLKNYQARQKLLQEQLRQALFNIPNPPAPAVPAGFNEQGNKILKKVGTPPKFDFKPRDNQELGALLKIIDKQRGAKVSGSRFYYLLGKGALLELALVRMAFDKLIKSGFIPVIPPVLVRDEMMRGMGYLEHGEKRETYHLDKDGLYLVGTAEQALGPLRANEIINEDELPIRYGGYSPSFRREAGTYGKDTRGILRVHQFGKVEMFVFCAPAQAKKEYQKLLDLEEEILQDLELPYRQVLVDAGDLGDPASLKIDHEVWLPSQKKYREITSASQVTDFQSRRLNIRYRAKQKNQFVFMMNATAIPIARAIVAILENHQTASGKIILPSKLAEYTGFDKIG